jgi:NADH dehydrogenase
MATRRVAAVFGGSGFIGRYLVKRLAADGFIVRVATRDPEAALFLKPMGAVGQIVPLFASFDDPATIARAVEGAELVVNLVGILAEPRRGAFERVQAQGAGAVATASSRAGVRRLAHVSAIGADPASPSLYAASKGRGEAAVRAAFPAATILRPSIVFGPEDKFFNRFAQMAQLLPFLPVICGDTRFQPVYVGDVADAVHAALTGTAPGGTTYELGGPDIVTFRDLLRAILTMTHRHKKLIEIPYAVAKLQALVAERLPGKPFTRDQLLLLRSDNVVGDHPGLAELGVTPTSYELIVPAYLSRYRPGGGSAGVHAPLRS